MEVAEPGNYLELLDRKRKWENGKKNSGCSF